MATEAADLDMMAAVAAFAVDHLHAVARSAPEPRNGVAPNVAAVAGDAVLFVNSEFVRCAVIPVAFAAG